ncbi:MAG TPA: ABC transporter permease [Methylomirabilota bacterium]|nr:ABC transporter permease [Methylomirabilota bacterium]HEV8673492.1 ABC transporter permease [Methylomirabilota bacterium]
MLQPPLAFYALLFLAPLLIFSVVSVFQTSQTGLFDPVFTLQHYAKALGDRFYLRSLWNTFEISLGVTLLCLALGYPVAYLLADLRPRPRKLLIILLLFPLLVSTIIRVYGWMVILGGRGIVNNFLLRWRLVDDALPLMFNTGTLYLGLVTILLPYMVINVTNVLVAIDPALGEAASIHGADRRRVFWRVTLPLSLPGVLSGCLLVFTISMSAYVIPLLLGGHRVKMLGNLVFESISSFNWPFAAALSLVLLGGTLLACLGFLTLLGTERRRAPRRA